MVASDEILDMTTMRVADIALKFPYAVDILNRYNLDFCCNSKKLFVDACKKANLDPEKIWQEIVKRKSDSRADGQIHFDTWEAGLLIDFIIQHHHQFVRDSIPFILEQLNKVCDLHGSDTPELLNVRAGFNKLANELLDHMGKEEAILFPAIRERSQAQSCSIGTPGLRGPIEAMEHEHDDAGELIKSIRAQTNQYTPPAYACPTFQLTYKILQEFDNDMMHHIHLENNILFPKALGGR